MCSYVNVCIHMHVIYPYPPWERHRVSVYKAVRAFSLTAYKFPWFPFAITTNPLLNNLYFTQPLTVPLAFLQKPNLSSIVARSDIDKSTFLTPAATNYHIIGLKGISYGRPRPKSNKGYLNRFCLSERPVVEILA